MAFTFLNYIDKAISFAMPLLVLYILKDIVLYNNIEVVFSYANIIVVIADLGIRIFFLYDYGHQPGEEQYGYTQRVKTYFNLSFLFYWVLSVVLCLTLNKLPVYGILMPFICIRTLLMLFINFFSVYYRLTDKPKHVLYYSIIINVLSIVLFLGSFKFFHSINLWWFFGVQMVFTLLYMVYGFKFFSVDNIKKGYNYIAVALKYSWPLIVNILLLTFINNYGKIYAFKNLPEESMFTFSYVLRIGMIVQMAHASIMGYYAKSIYANKSNKVDYKVYKIYNVSIGMAVFLAIAALYVVNLFHIIKKIDDFGLVVILFVYLLLWCQIAYFEQYINKMNKNKLILLFAVISMVVYLGMLFANPKPTINYVSVCMIASAIVNLALVLAFMKKYRLF